jgi:transcriptional regulator with XRE-family HTH domain
MSVWRLTDSSVRNRIRQLRREHQWTLRRLSHLSGVPLNTICRMESGGGTTLRNALRIADAFQLSVYEIWETLSPSETQSKNNRRSANAVALIVQELRAQRGWRLYDVSSVSGVSITTVASVEKGHLPTLNNALRIAAALGVSVHEIWSHKDSKQALAPFADEIPVPSAATPRGKRSKLPKSPRCQRGGIPTGE